TLYSLHGDFTAFIRNSNVSRQDSTLFCGNFTVSRENFTRFRRAFTVATSTRLFAVVTSPFSVAVVLSALVAFRPFSLFVACLRLRFAHDGTRMFLRVRCSHEPCCFRASVISLRHLWSLSGTREARN